MNSVEAMNLLRQAGFKLVLHWMPNLHGATVESDLEDFRRLFADPALCPDELKIYSTQLLPNAASPNPPESTGIRTLSETVTTSGSSTRTP